MPRIIVALSEEATWARLRHAGVAPDELRPLPERPAAGTLDPDRVRQLSEALGSAPDLQQLGAVARWG